MALSFLHAVYTCVCACMFAARASQFCVLRHKSLPCASQTDLLSHPASAHTHECTLHACTHSLSPSLSHSVGVRSANNGNNKNKSRTRLRTMCFDRLALRPGIIIRNQLIDSGTCVCALATRSICCRRSPGWRACVHTFESNR